MYLKNFMLLVTANISCAAILMLSKCSETINTVSANTPVECSLDKTSSLERVIAVNELEPHYCIEVNQNDIESLMKIVEAEAGNEDINGKLLVADVVINRVKSDSFPDSVTEVVYQKNKTTAQFSPVSNGRINTVTVSSDTKTAVYNALRGEDISKGALYFMARKYSEPQSVLWFDNNLNFLFTYGNHDFFS